MENKVPNPSIMELRYLIYSAIDFCITGKGGR